MNDVPAFCRDCDHVSTTGQKRCPACDSPRVLSHPELERLAIAHIDCDAFYASVEKRDDPSLRAKPLIVGGGRRGVVSAACYIARTRGVHSAMPMFKALKACPEAVVVRPDMAKYAAVSREVKAIFREHTPLVEPLSLDEAFLDLSGTEALFGRPPARTLAAIQRRIENDVGVTASVGLSYNKSLAKIASDLDKPRGFAVIGEAEAVDFLAERPVGLIFGAGKALQRRLARDGITRIGQLARIDPAELMARYGAMGQRLAEFSRGRDPRRVNPNAPTKSISAETTFERDITDFATLDGILWRLAEKVSARMKRAELSGRTVTLKLKGADFRIRTRSSTLMDPTQLADVIHRGAGELLRRECDGTAYRLIGVGLATLEPAGTDDPVDLADPGRERRARAERAMDKVRDRFGGDAILKGRGLSTRTPAAPPASKAPRKSHNPGN